MLSFPRLGGFTILGQLECDMCSGLYYSGTKTELLFVYLVKREENANSLPQFSPANPAVEVSDLGMLRRCLELSAIVTLTERLHGITGCYSTQA